MLERGFLHQCSDLEGLDDKARSGSLAGYIGFDCTAPSLHVGNLVGIMMLHWLQETGGKPVALMGGGTTMVGDPSGKDESRKLLTVAADRGQQSGHPQGVLAFRPLRRGRARRRSCPTTPIGSPSSTTSISCATSGGISRSTGCWRWIRSSCASPANRSSPSSNSTTCACRPTTSPSSTSATA